MKIINGVLVISLVIFSNLIKTKIKMSVLWLWQLYGLQ
jgi:hypothetical protein